MASFPISTFMYQGEIFVFPQSVLFGISVFLYCVREISAQLQERREGQGIAAKQGLSTVLCPPLHSCSWAESPHKWPTYKFPIWKITDVILEKVKLTRQIHNTKPTGDYIRTEYLRKGLVAALCNICMYLVYFRWMGSLHPWVLWRLCTVLRLGRGLD